MLLRDRYRGALLGLAAGDALGTTVEFSRRGSFRPVTDMVGGGPFGLKPGEWTDDTSMALCLAASLMENEGFDPRDQMERYCRWRDTGYMSSNGVCFDIGTTTSRALRRFRETGDPYSGSEDPYATGNGCIMRLAPVPLFFYPDVATAEEHAALSSRTTHGAEVCVDACRLMARILCRALAGLSREEVAFGDRGSFRGHAEIVLVADGAYASKSRDEIHGTGYAASSLEAALWCFVNTNSFREAVLTAVNLGDDADTTGAVCGQIAGAFYGVGGIPEQWLTKLALRPEIEAIADRLLELSNRNAR